MVGHRGKYPNLGSPGTWKMLSSDRLLRVEYNGKASR